MGKIALVVEPDTKLCEAHCNVLDSLGFDAVFCEGCVESALSAFEQNADTIGLIILELMLPTSVSDLREYLPMKQRSEEAYNHWLRFDPHAEDRKAMKVRWKLAEYQEACLGLLDLEGGIKLLEACSRAMFTTQLKKPVLIFTYRGDPEVIDRAMVSVAPGQRYYAEKGSITSDQFTELVRTVLP